MPCLADLAVIASPHRSAISHLTQGRGRGLRAERVADALRVPLEVLFVDPSEPVTDGGKGRNRARPPDVEKALARKRAQQR